MPPGSPTGRPSRPRTACWWRTGATPPRRSSGLTPQSPWNDLQVAYFAGEATWNHFVAPFLLARADFLVEETEPWHEDGQTWRRLLVTYPDTVVPHCRQQTYSFDDAGIVFVTTSAFPQNRSFIGSVVNALHAAAAEDSLPAPGPDLVSASGQLAALVARGSGGSQRQPPEPAWREFLRRFRPLAGAAAIPMTLIAFRPQRPRVTPPRRLGCSTDANKAVWVRPSHRGQDPAANDHRRHPR
jgi:hypothetical protein